MGVRVTWHDKRYEKETLDPAVVKMLNRIGAVFSRSAKRCLAGRLSGRLMLWVCACFDSKETESYSMGRLDGGSTPMRQSVIKPAMSPFSSDASL